MGRRAWVSAILLGVMTLVIASCGGSETEKIQTLPAVAPTQISIPSPAAVPTAIHVLTPIPTAVPVPTTPPLTPSPTFYVLRPTPLPSTTPVPSTPMPTTTVASTAVPESCTDVHETPIINGPDGPAGPDRDSVFKSLTVHPTDPEIVVLGTERNGFVRSNDGGLTWERLRAGMRSIIGAYSEIWDIDISPSNPSVIIAATLDSPGPILGTTPTVHAGIYKSVDGGQNWMQLNCGFITSRATSMRFHPANPDIAIAGLEGGEASYSGPDGGYYGGGIFRTEDGGESWQRVAVGENDERNGYLVMTVVPTSPPTFVTFGMNGEDLSQNIGFIRSTDSGKTWQHFGDQLRHKHIGSFTVSSDGQTMYADEGGAYFGWISRDAGETWFQSPVVQVNGPVAVSPVDPNLIVFGGFNQVRRSTNGLQNVNITFTAPLAIREIVFAPSDPTIVYAETDGYILYRSDDAGATWRLVASVRDDVLNVQP
jgi:hypothetical protein